MKKEMLINVLQPEECRIAILENGVMEELYIERTGHESYVNNIYKGKIVNIEPSIQAAFVDFGVGRNGFLHVSDVEPSYYRHLEEKGHQDSSRGSQRRGSRGGNQGSRPGPQYVKYRMTPEEGTPAPVPAEAKELAGLPPVEDQLTFTSEDAVVQAQDHVAEMESGKDQTEPEPNGREHFADVDVEEPTGVGSSVEDAAGEAPAEVVEPENEVEPLVALPETRIDVDEPRGRKRSRGGERKRPRRSRAADKSQPEEAGNEPGAEGEQKSAREGTSQEGDSEFMPGAEHRTEEGDNSPREPLEPEQNPSSSFPDDADLFFASEEEERAEEEQYSDEDEPLEHEPQEDEVSSDWNEEIEEGEGSSDFDDVEEAAAPPPRPTSYSPPLFAHDRVEDALAADLEAADIGDLPRQEYSTVAEETVDEFDDADVEIPPVVSRRSEPRRDARRGGGGRKRNGRPPAGRPKPLIQDIFRRGQEVIVKVIKEGIGTKGPTLSTYISIAGRYLVLMPGLNRTGVSRKIENEEQRRRLRQIFDELQPPKGINFIIRTAGEDRNKKELQRDLSFLTRLYQVIVRRIRRLKSPAEIYEESDMITRTIRDTFTSDIDTIWVDEPRAYEHAREFLQIVMPRYANRIKLYEGKEPIFHKYGIEDEIARIQQKKIPLPRGGSIVIEQTEALVAIDVNSGNFRADNNAEETAYQINLQAAKEIARQLRLRDLGGVIVNDFIDMREEKHRRGVEKALRDAVKRDRARTKILKMSAFGIIEMTRQRIRPSIKRSVYEDCAYCHGNAQVKTSESMSIEVMRLLQLASCKPQIVRVEVHVAEEVADYLLNRKRLAVAHLEESGNIQVTINGLSNTPSETLDFVCFDNNNNEVKLFGNEPSRLKR